MDTQRLILFFVFSFSLLLLWEAWQRENRPPPPPAPEEPEELDPNDVVEVPDYALGPWRNAASPVPPPGGLDTLDDVEAAIARDPRDLRLWKRRLELQRDARKLKKQLGIGEEPRQPYDFAREAQAWLAFAEPAEALAFFDAALAEDPSSTEAWRGRARALEALGRPAEAATAWAEFERRGGRREV